MIMRYSDKSNGTDEAKHASFMKDISKIIVDEYGTPMRATPTILWRLINIYHNGISNSCILILYDDVIKLMVLVFFNYLNLPPQHPHVVLGRFRSKSIAVWYIVEWKKIGGIFEPCFKKFSACHLVTPFQTCLFVGGILFANFKFNAQRSYVLISTMHACLLKIWCQCLSFIHLKKFSLCS